jgi:hypothetical protein
MFHRPLLRIVASDGRDRRLDELPGLLNRSSGGGRFFNSVLIRADPGGTIPSLRDFFGERLAANSPIFGGGDGIGAILPRGDFVDDLADCLAERPRDRLSETTRDRKYLGRRFVRIAVSGGRVGVVNRGVLDRTSDIVCHMRYGPSLKPRVDAELTVDILVEQLLRRAMGVVVGLEYPNAPPWEPTVENERMFARLVKFVDRENKVEDERVLYPVKPYLSAMSLAKWCDWVTKIRLCEWLRPPNRMFQGVRRSQPYR